ncbi:MAG: (2Fe-2S)-binding protein [Gammaproteobacteria bacterium]|nr:(2Fe-2S)-binding protein [Gammaproteobacteria bacterium]MDH3560491.1 (2Fe-2S)-binding protein [Gammaproteobacteria bacterium]
MLEIKVNGQEHALDIDPETPLLWVLRDHLHLHGTKYGCGTGLCGSCTVHLDDRAVRACLVPVSAVSGKAVTTIEGLGTGSLAVQQAWRELDVPQCGYCQPGMIMASVALLREKPSPTDADIAAAITNICRCGTYNRVRQAILAAAGKGEASDA